MNKCWLLEYTRRKQADRDMFCDSKQNQHYSSEFSGNGEKRKELLSNPWDLAGVLVLYRIINITTVSVTIHDRVGFTRVISCLKQEEYARMKKKELWKSSVKCDCMLYWS